MNFSASRACQGDRFDAPLTRSRTSTLTHRRTIAQIVEPAGFGLGAVVIGTLVIAVAGEQPRAGLFVQAASAAAAVGVLVLITRLPKGRIEVRS